MSQKFLSTYHPPGTVLWAGSAQMDMVYSWIFKSLGLYLFIHTLSSALLTPFIRLICEPGFHELEQWLAYGLSLWMATTYLQIFKVQCILVMGSYH